MRIRSCFRKVIRPCAVTRMGASAGTYPIIARISRRVRPASRMPRSNLTACLEDRRCDPAGVSSRHTPKIRSAVPCLTLFVSPLAILMTVWAVRAPTPRRVSPPARAAWCSGFTNGQGQVPGQSIGPPNQTVPSELSNRYRYAPLSPPCRHPQPYDLSKGESIPLAHHGLTRASAVWGVLACHGSESSSCFERIHDCTVVADTAATKSGAGWSKRRTTPRRMEDLSLCPLVDLPTCRSRIQAGAACGSAPGATQHSSKEAESAFGV